MPRTIFHHVAVNKPSNLANKNSIQIAGIKSYFSINIDRVQFSIDSRCYNSIQKNFKSAFKRGCPKIQDNRYIETYYVNNSEIPLVKYPRKSDYSTMWFSMGIQDPTRRSLEVIKNIIDNSLKSVDLTWDRVSLSQAEFAADFWAQKVEEQDKLFDSLKHSIVLKYSRSMFYFEYKTTTYQGKDGNVRKGTKGLRYYPKSVHGNNCFRIELQANRIFNASNKITIDNIFYFAESFNPFDYIYLYNSIEASSVNSIIKAIATKKRRNLYIYGSRFSQRVFEAAIRNYINDCVYKDESTSMHKFPLSVAKQMINIKNICSKYGLTYRKERLFTRMEINHTI